MSAGPIPLPFSHLVLDEFKVEWSKRRMSTNLFAALSARVATPRRALIDHLLRILIRVLSNWPLGSCGLKIGPTQECIRKHLDAPRRS